MPCNVGSSKGQIALRHQEHPTDSLCCPWVRWVILMSSEVLGSFDVQEPSARNLDHLSTPGKPALHGHCSE